jgi:hypothetical protein
MNNLKDSIEKIRKLEADLTARKTHYEDKEVSEQVCDGWSVGVRTEYRIDSVEVDDGPDTERIDAARGQLRNISNSLDELPVVRYAASKSLGEKTNSKLGYYPLRIWAHEHPVEVTLTGIVAAGATSGLVYALVEYFSK